jgi:hypothetical protein
VLINHKNMFDYDKENPLFKQSRIPKPAAGANGHQATGH